MTCTFFSKLKVNQHPVVSGSIKTVFRAVVLLLRLQVNI